MRRAKFSTTKNVDETCKELEQLIRTVLGTNPNRSKQDKTIVYHPARKYWGTDDLMDDISIIVRKVNNSLTNITLEDDEMSRKAVKINGVVITEQDANWRSDALKRAYSKLEAALNDMYR